MNGGKIMILDNYEFGFADATKEYSRLPQIFEIAFCDNRNIVSKLLNSYQFLLVGRKGVGKSAICSKIQSMACKSDVLYTFPFNMNDFEFSTFAKTSIDDQVSGTQKYKTSWDFLLLVRIFKILFNELQITECDDVTNMIDSLEKMGFSIDSGYKADVTRLSKIKIGIGIASFDAEFSKTFNQTPCTYLERISLISEKMLDILSNIYLNNREVVIIIDGMDDILRYKKNKVAIISSLIRSADYINDKMIKYHQKIKIIMLVREDLLSIVNDPDLNKIVQDGSIYISWNNRTDELKQLVAKRFLLSGKAESISCWDKIFPRK